MRYSAFTLAGLFALTFSLQAGASCVAITDGIASMQEQTVHLINDHGKDIALDVLVADDGFERASGFQHVCPEVIEETLILFRYPAEVNGRFHMQNVHAPLDIAFFDGQGSVVAVLLMETYSDERRPLYGPDGPFQFALEARVGFFGANDVSADASRLRLD